MQVSNRSWVAVVDPYSTGTAIPALLKELGYSVVHVQCGSDDSLHPLDVKDIDHCRSAFGHKIILDKNYDTVLEELRSLKVALVIPGYEGVVDIAESLAADLGCPTNTRDGIKARTNKDAMYRAVEAAGLGIAKFERFGDCNSALAWVQKEEVAYPLIVKPPTSAGMEGVYLCRNRQEIERAFAQTLGSTNILKRMNDELLVQEFIQGTEYAINAVTVSGRHFVTDAWVYKKRILDGTRFIYESITLCDLSQLPTGLLEYHQKTLDALGFVHGPSHGEFYVCSDGRIVLGEVGARAPGAHLPDALRMATDFDFMKTSLLSYRDPASAIGLLESHGRELSADHHKACRVVLLVSEQEGVIEQIDGSGIKEIPSVKLIELNLGVGQKLDRTIDLVTSPGLCVLIAASMEEIDRAEMEIRSIERKLFTLEPSENKTT